MIRPRPAILLIGSELLPVRKLRTDLFLFNVKGTPAMPNKRKTSIALLGLAFGLTAAGNAHSWGEEGHRVVGHIAEARLRNTPALERVRAILLPGETLADAAYWPDQVKSPSYLNGSGIANQEGKAFVRENPHHREYHYVNLPFQFHAYRLGMISTRRDPLPHTRTSRPGDIVQILRSCIRVLQSSQPSDRFTRREALRLLAHLAGDLHQPLHVGCGYLQPAADGRWTFVTPAGSAVKHDRGGNGLLFSIQVPRFDGRGPRQVSTNLHAFWDNTAVERAMRGRGAEESEAYAGELIREVAVEPHWRGRGRSSGWPARWAADTLVVARMAYDDVQPGQRVGEADDRTPDWRITLDDPDAYLNESASLSRVQLAKGGYRLAVLLRAIFE